MAGAIRGTTGGAGGSTPQAGKVRLVEGQRGLILVATSLHTHSVNFSPCPCNDYTCLRVYRAKQ